MICYVDKGAWTRCSLLNPEPYLEEINHCVKDHKHFLEEFGKKCDKLRRESANGMKDLIRQTE